MRPAGLNYETDYTYDTLDNLSTVNQKGGSTNSANWRTRTFTYNSLSQLLTAVNPESGTVTYTYDNNGNLSTKTFPQQNQANPAVPGVRIELKHIRAAMDKHAQGEITTEQLADWATMLLLNDAYDWEGPEEDQIAEWLNDISMLSLKPKSQAE